MEKFSGNKAWISLNLFGAVLSGVLLFLSFPRLGVGLMAWGALVPLFFALEKAKSAEGFRIGFLTGLTANIGIFYWISQVVVQYGYLPLYLGIMAMLLLASYLSLYTACFAAGVVYFRQKGLPLFLVAPVIWTILEYAKSHLLTGFPWANLGYSQYLQQCIIQISDITGVYGISCLIVMTNVFLYQWLSSGSLYRVPKIQAAILLLLFVVVISYGQYRVGSIRIALEKAESLDVALIQGNIDQNIKWDIAYQRKTLEIYETLSREAAIPPGGMIVWPETAAPFYFKSETPLGRGIIDTAKSTGAALLFGSPSYVDEHGKRTYLNSAYLLQPDGTVSGQYDKVHLVPYGEYVPFRRLFPFIGKLVEGVGDFGKGVGYQPLARAGHKLGVLICYEGIFPKGASLYKQRGAKLLVNITNDAWFGRTSAPYQHLSMTVFRAVENRLFLIRAANTGISAIIDPSGAILAKTGLFVRTSLKGQVNLIDVSTFYAAYSDVFVYLCGVALLVMLYLSIGKRRTGHHVGRNS